MTVVVVEEVYKGIRLQCTVEVESVKSADIIVSGFGD